MQKNQRVYTRVFDMKKRILIYSMITLFILPLSGCQKEETTPLNPVAEEIKVQEITPDISPTYLAETYYDGKQVIDSELYIYPFQISDEYINNKEFNQKYGIKNITLLEDKVRSYIETLYTTGYRTVVTNQDDFKKSLYKYLDETAIYTDSVTNKTCEEYIDHITEWIVDNQVIADVEIMTDRSLVWYDANYIVRAKISITNYGERNIPADSFSPLLTENQIKVGEKRDIICDFYFKLIQSGDFSSAKISQIKILSP